MQSAIEKIKAMDKTFLSPADVAPVLGSDPQTIRVTARQRPDLIGFNHTFVGNRMKIPRIPFIQFLETNQRRQPHELF